MPLPDGHRFPMSKYRAVREALEARGILGREQLAPAPLVTDDELAAVHDPAYMAAFRAGALPREAVVRIGFPWSEALVRRCLASVGGTLAATRAALRDGLAGHLAGGTHHAHRDFGAGYCVFNDLAVAAAWARARAGVARVLVFDADVHQGDGTAALFAHDDTVFTCSIHGERNFPLRKQRSDLDVELPDGTGDEAFLDALHDALAVALDRSRPELLLYQSGVDGLARDRLGRLALTHDGLRERDARVLGEATRLGIPTVITAGGGYAEPLEDTVEAHVGTWVVATRIAGVRSSGGAPA